MKEAAWYRKLNGGSVECTLCPHHCTIAPDQAGRCLNRFNRNGSLVAENFCSPVSIALDPIEKKPLYHFHPGTRIFSLGPSGCTMQCRFCQNHEISQTRCAATVDSPEHLAQKIIDSGAPGVAYTYSEPFTWYETIMDVGARAKAAGLYNVMVTNGYMEPGPLAELLTIVDAMNIDIKSMTQDFYGRLCGASLKPVLRTCVAVKKKAHLEITTLLIPGENDSPEEIAQLADFVATELGPDTPLHLSRYFPRYKLMTPPTPLETLDRAYRVACERLHYVFTGNVDSGQRSNTRCPRCNATLVQRNGYTIEITSNLLRTPSGVCCTVCDTQIPLIV